MTERGVSNQTVVVLALVLVLLVIGGTFLILQELKAMKRAPEGGKVAVFVAPPSSSIGQVGVYVIAPESQNPAPGG